MKKRLVLCALAGLLTLGALASRPAYACLMHPVCDCFAQCGPDGGVCNTCAGGCRCNP